MIAVTRRRTLTVPQSVGDIIERVMKREKLPFSREDRTLRHAWERAVGETIATQTHPERIARGVLYVRVTTSAWRQELHFLKGEIITGFNAASGLAPIEDIRFFLGEVSGPRSPACQEEVVAASASLTPRDRRMVTESLSRIPDGELREIIRRVMEKEISRRRREQRQDR